MKDLPRPSDITTAVLVTHQGCMDGSTCAILFMAAGGKQENIRYIAAGMVERFVKEDMPSLGGKFLIFADVGVATPKYADILEKRGDVVLIDHHKTSLHMVGRPWCHIDAEGNGGSACGAELFRRYLCTLSPELQNLMNDDGTDDMGDYNVFRSFCKIVDDHDRWLRKIPISEKLANLMTFIGQRRFVGSFRDLKSGRITWGTLKLEPFEANLLDLLEEKKHETIDSLMKHVIVRDFLWGGTTIKIGYSITSEMNVSLLLDVLLKRYPEVNVAAQINPDKSSVSFRSRGDVDVSELAKYFGGGGHYAAAGHSIKKSVWDTLISEVHGE